MTDMLKIPGQIEIKQMKNNSKILHENDKIIIKSQYAKLSDIANEDLTNIKSIEIFALSKVFIDTNLNTAANLTQIIIIAPEWEIINNPEIRFNNKSTVPQKVKSFVGIGQDFHGHGHLKIFIDNSEINKEQWFGKNIKFVPGDESSLKNDNFVDTNDFTIIKLSNHFKFPLNEQEEGIHIINAENGRNTRGQIREKDSKIHFLINKFKRYSREILNTEIQENVFSIQETFLRKFIERLDNDEYVKNAYTTLGFINELYDIEDQFFTYGKQISFLPFYQSFLFRIKEYTNNNINELTNDDKKVLSYLNAVVVSKVYCNKDDIPDYFADYLDKSLERISKDIKELMQSNDINDATFVNNCRLNEQKLIAETNNEIHNFIDTQIKPNINASSKSELNSKKLIQSNMLSSTLKILTKFLNFASALGVRATSIIKNDNENDHVTGVDDLKMYRIYTISDLSTALENFNSNMKSHIETKKQHLEKVFSEVEQELTLFIKAHPASNELNEIQSKIAETKENLNKIRIESLSMEQLYNIQEEIFNFLQQRKESLEKQNAQTNSGVDDQLKILNRITEISSMAQLSLDFYNEIKSDASKINNIMQTIKQNEDDFKQFIRHEKNINAIIEAAYAAIDENVKDLQKTLQAERYATITTKKWQMQTTLENLQHEIRDIAKSSSKLPESVTENLEKVDKITTSIIRMYKRIENLYSKIQWVAYVANIKSSKMTKIELQNNTLKTAINKLKLVMRSNLIVKKNESAMGIFKQEIYPFSDYYFKQYELPAVLQSTDTNTLFFEAAKLLEDLSSDYIMASRITITKIDEIITISSIFDSIFTWKYDKYNDTILELLEGKEIALEADIRKKSSANKHAIKFKQVRINIKAANETIQSELNKDLRDFKLTMKHSGKSYYRCDHFIHVIPSDSYTISYSIAKDKDGNPLKTNDVYNKLKKHEPVLSPFTTWYVQLSNIYGDFRSLEKYKNEVIDLELEAKTTFVYEFDLKTDGICNNNMNKYYTLNNTIPVANRTNPSYRWKREIVKYQSHRSNLMNDENLSRKRRGDSSLSTNPEYATSGSSSSMKSSILNKIVKIVGTHFLALKYLNPFDQINTWFTEDNKNIMFNKESLIFDNNLFVDSTLTNIRHLPKKLISHTFAEDETSTLNDALGYSSICHHGNLLLLDLIVRQKSGIKLEQQNFGTSKAYDCEYAQNLAYRGYVSA